MHIPYFPSANHFTLENGLKTIIHTDTSHSIVCLQLFIRTGSNTESTRQRGFSHFIEHLVFKQTRDFDFNEITLRVCNLGGTINAYTDSDSTCFYLMLPSENYKEGFYILSQMAIHPLFDSEDIDTEKEIIIEEMNQYANDPEASFLENILQHYLNRNPMGRPILGSPEFVKKATLKGIMSFYKKYYTASNSFLIATGDLSAEFVRSAVEEYFGEWSSGSALQYSASLLRYYEPQKTKFRQTELPGRGNSIALVIPELPDTHADATALSLAVRYLSYGRASVLHKALVEVKRLCASIKVLPHSGILSGATSIILSPVSIKANQRLVEIMVNELAQLHKYGIPTNEFEMTRTDIIHSWAYDMDGNENIAGMIGSEELLGDYTRLYQYPHQIQSLTTEHVNEAIRKYLIPDLLAIYTTIDTNNQAIPIPMISKNDFFPKSTVKPTISTRHKSTLCPVPGIHLTSVCTDSLQIDSSHRMYSFSNGLRFAHGWRPERDICGYAISFPISQLCERHSERGLNYFTSSAMLYATKNHNSQQLINICRELGLDIGISHQTDCTIVSGKCQSKNLQSALCLLHDVVFEPLLSPRALATVKTSVRDEILRERDYPETRAYLKWLGMLLGKDSLFERATGQISDIRTISATSIKNWHSRYYQAAGCVLSICSPIPASECVNMVEQIFSYLPDAGETPHIQDVPTQSPPMTKVEKQGSQQAIIHVGGFAAPGSDQIATTALHILAQIIGGESSSRLFDILREEHAYAYQCGMDVVTTRDLTYWYVYAMCDHSEPNACMDAIKDILADVARKGVTADELNIAQNYLVGMHRFDSESATYQAMELSSLLALGYPPDHVINRETRIRSVSLESINAYAKEWLAQNKLFSHILL